jgi:hypothetical protein
MNTENSERSGATRFIAIMGYISIAFSWLYGIPGFLVGLFAYKFATSLEFRSSGEDITRLNAIKQGKLIAILGMIFSGIFFFLYITKNIISFLGN